MRKMARWVIWSLALSLSMGLASCGKPPAPSSSEKATQKVAFGAFTVDLPSTWKPFPPDEMTALREQFQAQSKEIYQRYNRGAEDPARDVDFVAYRSPDGTSFIGLILVIPPQADLMGDLKREAGEKAKWGIEQGFIKRASEVKPVARDGFDGFYIAMDNAKGTHDFTGGLVHSSRKTEVVSIMLLGVQGDEASPQAFEKLLGSVNLSGTASTAGKSANNPQH
jgi:hypothetical protein